MVPHVKNTIINSNNHLNAEHQPEKGLIILVWIEFSPNVNRPVHISPIVLQLLSTSESQKEHKKQKPMQQWTENFHGSQVDKKKNGKLEILNEKQNLSDFFNF